MPRKKREKGKTVLEIFQCQGCGDYFGAPLVDGIECAECDAFSSYWEGLAV